MGPNPINTSESAAGIFRIGFNLVLRENKVCETPVKGKVTKLLSVFPSFLIKFTKLSG